MLRRKRAYQCSGNSQDLTGPTGGPTSGLGSDEPLAESRHDEQQPVELPGSQPSPSRLSLPAPPVGGRTHRFVEIAAEEVVELLRETVAPNLWRSVLARANEMLDNNEAREFFTPAHADDEGNVRLHR